MDDVNNVPQLENSGFSIGSDGANYPNMNEVTELRPVPRSAAQR